MLNITFAQYYKQTCRDFCFRRKGQTSESVSPVLNGKIHYRSAKIHIFFVTKRQGLQSDTESEKLHRIFLALPLRIQFFD